MLRITLSILLIFGLLQLNYSQNKIQQIKPEKLLYKKTNEGDLNLFVYKPSEFDIKKKYSCIIFFTEAVGRTDHLNSFKDNQDILLQEEW